MRPQRIEPRPGQESVWDYPRPPVVEASESLITVSIAGTCIAESKRTLRILETSQPPAYYIPKADVDFDLLAPSVARTFCEWKGAASFFDLVHPEIRLEQVAWTYTEPNPAFAAVGDHVAFYPRQLSCAVDGERVEPNEGSFYGGWITSKVVGPFKGGPGTAWW